MTAFFEAALAASGAVHDSLYGESFLIEPRAQKRGDPNGRKIADPARPSRTIVGVWTDPQAMVAPTNRTGHPAGEGARFDDSKPQVDFERAALPYDLVMDDLVTRVKTGERFAVSGPGDDGFTRVTISLTGRIGRR